MKFVRIADTLYPVEKVICVSLKGAHIWVLLSGEKGTHDIRFNTRAEAREVFEELANS